MLRERHGGLDPARTETLKALRVPFLVYAPLGLLLLALCLLSPITISSALGLASLGFLLWTLLEYLFHRYLLHLLPRGRLRRLMAGRHTLHHKSPIGHPGIVLLWVSALQGGLFFAALCAATGLDVATGIMSGLVAGYLGYEYLHLRAHTVESPRSRWSRMLRAHHIVHHERSARTNYAITLPLWDLIFGTAWHGPSRARRRA